MLPNVIIISYTDHITNAEVRRKVQAAIGEYDELLTLIERRRNRVVKAARLWYRKSP